MPYTEVEGIIPSTVRAGTIIYLDRTVAIVYTEVKRTIFCMGMGATMY
ncbi:MAG: hypothetical protein CLLPBCKN_003128 [Chroococcidiopsis cubana SAG 39.79]|nr:hypothetical protein [Chroococcidiopsis cubana SAG 39.79]